MTPDVIVVNTTIAVTFIGSLARNWYISRGYLRQVYWLMIMTNISNFILNVVIAYEKPAYAGLYLFNIITVHSLYSAIKGLRRLNHDKL